MNKRITILLFFVAVCLSAMADNFRISYGENAKIYAQNIDGMPTQRAVRLFGEDYSELFGGSLSTTPKMEEAKIIVAPFDNAELKKFAKLHGLNFGSMAGRPGSFMLKVHNNGKQLLIVGGDDRGAAFGLMTISRMLGVSPFRWWTDAPALPVEKFELGVAYEKIYTPSIPTRTLILNGAQEYNSNLQDLLLRLRATGVTNSVQASDHDGQGIFRWTLNASVQPYLGLNLALDHPERIRLEALRAYNNGCRNEWQIQWGHQLGGELQLFLFFDMAWDLQAYREIYAVDQLEDLHFTMMSGVENNWSRIWNDFFDLTMMVQPDKPMSLEALRRGIGEAQSIGLQLSLDMSEKVVPSRYTNSFFRTVEYPLNMTMAQMQRLCNMQLVQHDAGKPWSVDDCRQRMELLAAELPDLIAPKWRLLMGALQQPTVVLGQSLMRVDDYKVSKLEVGNPKEPLPSDEGTALIYRSNRAIGTQVVPFEPFKLPLNYKSESLHLRISALPTKSYDRKPMRCLVSVDGGDFQMFELDQKLYPSETQNTFDLVLSVNADVESHEIAFRTMSDGIFIQRVWLCDMK